GFIWSLFSLVLSVLGVYVLGLIIDALAPSFGVERNSGQALKVAVYSMTPAWVASVLMIIPRLAALVVLAYCYGIYVLYLGLGQLMKAPSDKLVPYTAAAAASGIGIGLIVYFVASAIA